MRFSFRSTAVLALAGALTAGGLRATPAAEAASAQGEPQRADHTLITDRQVHDAIVEARDLGYVVSETTTSGGVPTATIDLGEGFTFDLTDTSGPSGYLSAGSDGYGKYVAFNSFDQGAIISGSGWALSAGLCALSAGTFCVVVGALMTAATYAVSVNGLRCGNKAMRVYPFSGHAPRCA
ncbi:hypothetical protein [Frondihabitans cladoniiphilus]|uniref:Uncharacterized protein n=1 Tax=Frondihabitans cladoniiphilus TaxID=715785 RepID=A0ABP8W2Z5_9MICO